MISIYSCVLSTSHATINILTRKYISSFVLILLVLVVIVLHHGLEFGPDLFIHILVRLVVGLLLVRCLGCLLEEHWWLVLPAVGLLCVVLAGLGMGRFLLYWLLVNTGFLLTAWFEVLIWLVLMRSGLLDNSIQGLIIVRLCFIYPNSLHLITDPLQFLLLTLQLFFPSNLELSFPVMLYSKKQYLNFEQLLLPFCLNQLLVNDHLVFVFLLDYLFLWDQIRDTFLAILLRRSTIWTASF